VGIGGCMGWGSRLARLDGRYIPERRRKGRGGEECVRWLTGCLPGWIATLCSRVTAIATTTLTLYPRLHSVAPFLHHAIDDPRITRQTSRRRVCCRCERIGIKVECAVCVLRLAAPRVKKIAGGEARQCLSRRREHAKKEQVPNLVTYHLELPFQRHVIRIFPPFTLHSSLLSSPLSHASPLQSNQTVSHPQTNV
jgi:hypothetical protein